MRAIKPTSTMSGNRTVNDKGKIHGGKGFPRNTNDGKSLDKNATNVIVKGVSTEPYCPSANAASINAK